MHLHEIRYLLTPGADVSIIIVPRVAHVGAYDPQAPAFYAGADGIGLSVSEQPEREGARGRNAPAIVWLRRLDKRGGRFVNGYESLGSAMAWAAQQQQIIIHQRWQLIYYDAELHSKQSLIVDTRDDAQKAAEERDLQQADIRTIEIPQAQGALAEHLEAAYEGEPLPVSTLKAEVINRYIISRQIAADGVWYPESLFARHARSERGLLLPERLLEWGLEVRADRPHKMKLNA